jgi:hypothetical protein
MQISPEDMATLNASFDREKAAIQSVFNSYLQAPNYVITGSNIDRKKSPRRMLSFPCKVGLNHAFIDSASNCARLDSSSSTGGGGGIHNLGGVSLMGLGQFAMDFDLHPTVLPPSLLFEIFEDILIESSTKVLQNSFEGRSPTQSECAITPDMSWNSSSRAVQSPGADQGEPLLSLTQVRCSPSVSFHLWLSDSLCLRIYLFLSCFVSVSVSHTHIRTQTYRQDTDLDTSRHILLSLSSPQLAFIPLLLRSLLPHPSRSASRLFHLSPPIMQVIKYLIIP